jgi:hypothetical protein
MTESDLFAIRDRALVVLLEIAENPDYSCEDRGVAADLVLRDVLEHRQADIQDRTEQVERQIDQMEEVALALRAELDKHEAKA